MVFSPLCEAQEALGKKANTAEAKTIAEDSEDATAQQIDLSDLTVRRVDESLVLSFVALAPCWRKPERAFFYGAVPCEQNEAMCVAAYRSKPRWWWRQRTVQLVIPLSEAREFMSGGQLRLLDSSGETRRLDVKVCRLKQRGE